MKEFLFYTTNIMTNTNFGAILINNSSTHSLTLREDIKMIKAIYFIEQYNSELQALLNEQSLVLVRSYKKAKSRVII